jgi:signal recognition particle subunit SEC65
MAKTKTSIMTRDSKTGRIVSKNYAKKHPSTTTVEKRATVTIEYKVARDSKTGEFTSAKQERTLTLTPSVKKAMNAAKSLAEKKGLKK